MSSQFASVPLVFYISMAIGVLNLVAVAIGLTIAHRQLTRTHDWNRRKASQDFVIQLASGEIRALRGRLEAELGAKVFTGTQTYAEALNSISTDAAKAECTFMARTVLNYFETMAIGIKNHVLDEQFCFDYAAETVLGYWKWAAPLVKEVRPYAPFAWVDLQELAEKWTEQDEARRRKQRASARLPGRRPT